MEVVQRAEAKERGLKAFFTGIPCVRGHIEVRSVANGVCYQCRRDSAKKHRALDVEKDRQHSREWYAKNKERAIAWKKNWIAQNPEKYVERRKRYRSRAETRAKEMLAMAKWSAKKKQVAFDLDYKWILEKLNAGTCEMTGVKFDIEPLPQGRQNPYTASLDRVKPELGYTKTNVRMILWALNAAFNTYGEHIYADIARVFLAKNPNAGTKLT